ncbi:MAG: hemolysin family protein [Elusimicrobiota bacterium]|jgi:CBS domain containing-hemolysin-like protein|nr:hemolysin family protein [Elusimicrobiota bacterium]
MSAVILIKIIILIVLFFSLACFSLSETAIVSLTESAINKLKKQSPRLSASIAFWEKNTEEAITAIIIGLNLSVTGISVISASIISDISFDGIESDILFSAGIIIITLIFGNIFPKTFARYNSEKAAPIVLPFVAVCAKVFKPAVIFFSKISQKIVKIISKNKESRSVNADEIDFLLSNENTSPLSDDSREMAGNIMDFSETRVSQVMSVRSDLFAVDMEKDRKEIIKEIIDSQYSRVPVYKEHLSNITGIIYSKDLALAWRNSEIIILEDLIRPVYYVPESANVNSVLKEFKSGHHHCAVVVDEFGLTVGIVSIEDLLEEIVGEVSDEYDDTEEKHIITYGYGRQEYLIQGQESVLNVNDDLNIDIKDGDYSTIGGWVLSLFGKIPKNGEKIRWKNYEIEIKDADEKKINRILLRCITK